MKKTKIVNKKGFILVETLIVGVFIMGIFSLLYTNFFPLIGEYERYKDYDTVESTYIAHWARMIALKGLPESVYTTASNTGYVDISDCSLYTNSDGIASCSAFINMNNVSKIYLTPYSTVDFKNFVKDNSSFSRSFREYISYLPTYSKNNNKTPDSGYYRVIVEYVSNDVYRYGNIEVYIGGSEDNSSNAGDVIIDNLICDATYDDGVDTFITSSCGDPNNYIWYSGKLWRAVSINNEAKTVKLVTQWNISAIPYNASSNTAFAGSYMEEWLNDTTVDGFLGNLRDYENFIVTDATWDATLDATSLGSITRPNGTTTVTDAVGLLNMYEYQSSYTGTTYSNGYLNNGLWWWTLTPYSTSNVRDVGSYGNANNNASIHASGVRPSINLKSSVKIVDGDGTIDNPYRLNGDNDTNLSGTLLSSRYSGEYIRFGNDENNLYRIVSHETKGLTKITSDVPLKNSGSYIESVFGSNSTFSSSNTIGTFLNNEYLDTTNGYLKDTDISMIAESTTWYLGTVGNGTSYKLAKYTDTNMSGYAKSTNAKVGLLRLGELMAGQFGRYGNNTDYWTLTPYSASNVRDVYYNGFASNYTSPNAYGVRPSINLKSNVVITGGDGTINNPFTLKLG